MALILGLAGVIAALSGAALSPLVIAAGITDVPDRPRKLHQAPTPTSGGLAVWIAFALGVGGACFAPFGAAITFDRFGMGLIGWTSTLAFAALALGLVDDLSPLSALAKLVTTIVLCLGAAVFVAHADLLPLYPGVSVRLGLAAGVAGSALWVFVLMNGTNFMDGANGLAMGSTAIGLAGLAVVAALCAAPASALMAAAGAGALVGFLVWNWPSGRLFAGDCGALFAGMLAGAVSLAAVREGGVSPFVMGIIFLPTLADTLLTLAWRAHKRRNLVDGHREHAYQIAIRAGVAPARVTMWYWLASAVCALAGVGAGALQRKISVLDAHENIGAHILAQCAGAAPLLLLVGGVSAALWASVRVRAYATQHGLDGE